MLYIVLQDITRKYHGCSQMNGINLLDLQLENADLESKEVFSSSTPE
jgi:hypothetical protein